MGKVLFQELPGLWQGVPALPSCRGQLCTAGRKEQLVLSEAATKSPQRQRVVLQNSNELSTLNIPTAPLAPRGWAGQGRGDIRGDTTGRGDEITLKG